MDLVVQQNYTQVTFDFLFQIVVELKMWPCTCFYFPYLWSADLLQTSNTEQHNTKYKTFLMIISPTFFVLYKSTSLYLLCVIHKYFSLEFGNDCLETISKCILTEGRSWPVFSPWQPNAMRGAAPSRDPASLLCSSLHPFSIYLQIKQTTYHLNNKALA